jgi:broad specificity phosphatase PhoE
VKRWKRFIDAMSARHRSDTIVVVGHTEVNRLLLLVARTPNDLEAYDLIVDSPRDLESERIEQPVADDTRGGT